MTNSWDYAISAHSGSEFESNMDDQYNKLKMIHNPRPYQLSYNMNHKRVLDFFAVVLDRQHADGKIMA